VLIERCFKPDEPVAVRGDGDAGEALDCVELLKDGIDVCGLGEGCRRQGKGEQSSENGHEPILRGRGMRI